MAAIPRRMAEPSSIYFTTDLRGQHPTPPGPLQPARDTFAGRFRAQEMTSTTPAAARLLRHNVATARDSFPAPSHAVTVRLSSWITLCSRRDRGTDTIITTFHRPMHPTCHRVMGISILRSKNAMRVQLQKPEVRSSCVNFARSQ